MKKKSDRQRIGFFILPALLAFLVINNDLKSQNLVPNPGFEEFELCPNNYDQFNNLKYWKKYAATPDLLSGCTHNKNIKVPNNFFGKMMPTSGGNYAGIVTFHNTAPNEIIGVKLLQKLKKGTTYQVSFNVCLAEKYSGKASNNIGILFTDHPERDTLTNKAHVNADQILKEAHKWEHIEGNFKADADYQYLLLGNFFEASRTKFHNRPQGLMESAYYYIDDVSVQAITDSSLISYSGEVIDAQNKQAIQGQIVFKEVTEDQYDTLKFKGKYELKLPKGKIIELEIQSDTYYPEFKKINTKENIEEERINLQPLRKGETIVMKHIYFDFAKSTLQVSSKEELNALSRILQKYPDMKILISGHTDNTGSHESNKKLSNQRAENVKSYLLKSGINKERITNRGFGETKPLLPNTSEYNKAINRRVEFTITAF